MMVRNIQHVLDAVNEQQLVQQPAPLGRYALVRWLNTLPGVRVGKERFKIHPMLVEATTRKRYDLYTDHDVIRKGAEERGWFITHEAGGYVVLQSRACQPVGVPPHLWHATEAENVGSVRRQGLRPSTGGDWDKGRMKYPPRVYFVTRSPSQIANMGLHLSDPRVFEVDTSKVPGLELCEDPEVTKQAAVFTEQAIPPKALKYLGKAGLPEPEGIAFFKRLAKKATLRGKP